MDTPTSKGNADRSTAGATRIGTRADLSVVELEWALEIELRHVRTLLREVAANYVSALESDIERVIETIGDNHQRTRVRQVALRDILDRIRALKVKPEKGRQRDMKRIDKLIGELVEWAEQ